MPVDDLWYLRAKDANGARLPSARHGRGKRWRVRWADTAGQQRTMLFDRKVDADRHDAAMRTDVSRGTYLDPRAGKVTLREYATAWLAAQTFDPSTREAVELRLRVHVYPVLGNVELRALAQRPQTVQAWVRGLQDRLAPNYCRTIFANLSAVFMAAVDDGEMARNPCRAKSVKPPSKEERRVRPWSTERVASVRAGLPVRYAATVDAGAGLGLRQGETFGLAVDDLDWSSRIVHVRFQIKYVGARLVFAPPKGGKERDVPLPGTTAARFAAHLEQWPAIAVTLPWLVPTGKPVTRTLLFTGRERTGINRNYYNSHLWKPALVTAGVIGPRVGEYYDPSREHGFHALRHAYASWLLANGVDIRSLADYLGHADPGFTLRVYTHLMPSSEEKTRKAIDLALGAAVDGLPSSLVPGLYGEGA